MTAERVLVTGATGFVGTALVRALLSPSRTDHWLVRGAVRDGGVVLPAGAERVVLGDLAGAPDYAPALAGVSRVVHLAARVHVMRERDADVLAAYRRVNVGATLSLARAAARAGVRQFVYLSSVKANGEHTEPDHPFTELVTRRTGDPYGLSKLEAEEALLDLGAETGLAVTIIRPPLVYGPGVRANFASLTRAIAGGRPLPLGAIINQRSLVGTGNLVHFIETCLRSPAAMGEVFLVSDGEDLSTPDLVRHIAQALGVAPRLFSVPRAVLVCGATVVGRGDAARRLFDSLQVDIAKARTRLDWTPPETVDAGLRAMVAASGRAGAPS